MNLKQLSGNKSRKIKDGMSNEFYGIRDSCKVKDGYQNWKDNAIIIPFDAAKKLNEQGLVNSNYWQAEYYTNEGEIVESMHVANKSLLAIPAPSYQYAKNFCDKNGIDFFGLFTEEEKNEAQKDGISYFKNGVSDSRRVKDEFIDNLYYNFGGSGRYNEDYEMYDEDYDVAEYLMNEADLLENKYSVYEREGDTVENWEQCIRGYFDLVDKTDVKDVDSVFRILEDANFHILNWVLLLEKGTDKDVQEAIDFIFDDTDNYIQRNQRYTALRNVINEMGIA